MRIIIIIILIILILIISFVQYYARKTFANWFISMQTNMQSSNLKFIQNTSRNEHWRPVLTSPKSATRASRASRLGQPWCAWDGWHRHCPHPRYRKLGIQAQRASRPAHGVRCAARGTGPRRALSAQCGARVRSVRDAGLGRAPSHQTPATQTFPPRRPRASMGWLITMLHGADPAARAARMAWPHRAGAARSVVRAWLRADPSVAPCAPTAGAAL